MYLKEVDLIQFKFRIILHFFQIHFMIFFKGVLCVCYHLLIQLEIFYEMPSGHSLKRFLTKLQLPGMKLQVFQRDAGSTG